MNKLSNTTPDLDAELRRFEAGSLGQELYTLSAEHQPDPATLSRLQSRLRQSTMPRRAENAGLLSRLIGPGTLPVRTATLLGMIVVALLAGALFANLASPRPVSAAELLQKAEARADVVVQPGQVRHIAREITLDDSSDQFDSVIRTETWLMQGKDHLVQRWVISQATPGSDKFEVNHLQVIGEALVQTLDPSGNTVYQGPFMECALDLKQWLGDKEFLSWAAKQPDARLLEPEQIDGRQAQVVEVSNMRMWIDPTTGQILQSRKAAPDDRVFIQSDRLTADEIFDAATAPAGLFTFPMPKDAKVVELSETCSKG